MPIVYKPLAMGFSVLGGVVAGSLFKRTWKALTGRDEAPEATRRDHDWREVLLAAAIQGALFGLVKAAVDRAGARGFEKVTGIWPGDRSNSS